MNLNTKPTIAVGNSELARYDHLSQFVFSQFSSIFVAKISTDRFLPVEQVDSFIQITMHERK